MKLKIKIFAFMLFSCSFLYGQMEQYSYKRELINVSRQWHSIILPDEIFGKTSQNLTDIRIFGITPGNDTVEAPYLLRLTTEKISSKEIAFKIINASHNNKGYYFTFEVPSGEPVNRIKLEFRQPDFDWPVTLEGSQNQEEWVTVIEDYRILSIKNELTDFQFTTLAFPESKYRYFRLLIDSKEKPDLIKAGIAQHEVSEGTFRNYPIRNIITTENKQAKQTEADIELQMPVRASHIRIVVSDKFDYYRPLTIKYLSDSIHTEQGWKYIYSTLTSGTLNSIEKNEFKFSSTTVQKLKIVIQNQDNQPLTIDTIKVKGYVHELVTRFADQATYFLTYGDTKAERPHYDIDRFSGNIPVSLTSVEPGNEMTIEKEDIPVTDPLFKNKKWLWTILVVIILLLGWFSVRMIRKK
ncbi:MAG: DUF3999 family protein [Lentimicrobium sp.]